MSQGGRGGGYERLCNVLCTSWYWVVKKCGYLIYYRGYMLILVRKCLGLEVNTDEWVYMGGHGQDI